MPRREKQVAIPRELADASPVARAWIIASAMPRASRREVIAACTSVGIPAKIASLELTRQRYARKQAIKARQLPAGVRRMIAKAAASVVQEARAD